MDGRANPLMDRKVLGVVFFWEWLQWLQWSPHPHLLDVVWCSAVVVVVSWSCNWSVVYIISVAVAAAVVVLSKLPLTDDLT